MENISKREVYIVYYIVKHNPYPYIHSVYDNIDLAYDAQDKCSKYKECKLASVIARTLNEIPEPVHL